LSEKAEWRKEDGRKGGRPPALWPPTDEDVPVFSLEVWDSLTVGRITKYELLDDRR
jgi:hypothetical protein